MFRKSIDIVLVALLIIGSLGMAGVVVFTNRPVDVAAMPAEQLLVVQTDSPQTPLLSADDASTNSSSTAPKGIFPIVKTKNNIKIELLRIELGAGFLYADICFEFPSDNPAWSLGGPDNLKLSNGVAEIGVYSIEMIPDPQTGLLKKDQDEKYVGRCDRVGFPLTDGFVLENLKLSIGKLVTDLPDSPDCNKVQAKLDSKNSGIKIKCVNELGKSGIEVVLKPKGMDDVQAQKFITESLTESVEGLWEFEIGIP